MKILKDKGLFLNDLTLHTAAEWAEACARVGAKHVGLRVDFAKNTKLLQPVAAPLHAKGIRIWAWQYIRPDNPAGSAHIAARDCAAIALATGLEVAAFLVDAEGPYNLPGNLDDQAARVYMRELRTGLGPNVPIGLCSYRYPTYQPNFPWQTFLLGSDFHAPQVYWMDAHNPAYQLRKSIAELQTIKTMPVVPAGAAFSEHGWKSAAPEVEEFMDAALEAGCPGLLMWYGDEMFDTTSWHFKGSTVADRQAWCSAFKAGWPGALPPEPPDTPLFMDLPDPLKWGVVERIGRKVGLIDLEGHPIG